MDTVQKAMKTLKQAMIDEGGEPGTYAHGWHCNIAMMCYDAILQKGPASLPHTAAHRIANDAASRFMKLCFDVETKA